MEPSSEAQRQIDSILERQNKRALGEGVDDVECRTPPYPRAARAARAASTRGELVVHVPRRDTYTSDFSFLEAALLISCCQISAIWPFGGLNLRFMNMFKWFT